MKLSTLAFVGAGVAAGYGLMKLLGGQATTSPLTAEAAPAAAPVAPAVTDPGDPAPGGNIVPAVPGVVRKGRGKRGWYGNYKDVGARIVKGPTYKDFMEPSGGDILQGMF